MNNVNNTFLPSPSNKSAEFGSTFESLTHFLSAVVNHISSPKPIEDPEFLISLSFVPTCDDEVEIITREIENGKP